MGLKHVIRLSLARPSRNEARYVIRYLRYYDPRTYRAVTKFFQVKYGIQAEEWADSLVDGGKWRKFYTEYMRYFPRHDWGRHYSVLILFGLCVPGWFILPLIWIYHQDHHPYAEGAVWKWEMKRRHFSE